MALQNSAKARSAYFWQLKEKVEDGEVVQDDSLKKFPFHMGRCTRVHWKSLQCNLHYFVGYWREEGMLCHQSYCCIFDGTKHNNRDGSCLLKELTCSRELQGSSHTEENPLPISATAVQASKKNKYKFAGKRRYVIMTILTERPASGTFLLHLTARIPVME